MGKKRKCRRLLATAEGGKVKVIIRIQVNTAVVLKYYFKTVFVYRKVGQYKIEY